MLTASPATESIIRDPDYARLKALVIESTGLWYYTSRDQAFSARVAERCRHAGADSCASYLRLLTDPATGDDLMDRLVEDLTVGETHFFRHRELFDALRDRVLPDVMNRNASSRKLRIWCAGCSIGAEPYSVSILLARELAHRCHDWDVSILGTDINRKFLVRAVRARFDKWALRGLSESELGECFQPRGKSWLLAQRYRQGVSFQYHNLVKHPFPSLVHNLVAFDVILCRNVLIYFDRETIARVVRQTRECLVDGGWLLVGHAEHLPSGYDGFEPVDARGAVIYRKSPDVHLAAVRQPGERLPLPAALGEPPAGRNGAARRRAAASSVARSDHPSPGARREETESRTAVAAPQPVCERLAGIRALADRGRVEAAISECDALAADHPLNPALHLYRALLLDQLGHYAQAERALRWAVFVDANHVLARYHLALLHAKQCHRSDAVRELRNVLALLRNIDPNQPLADADGLTVRDLTELAHLHLAVSVPT